MSALLEKLLVFFSEFTWRRFFALLVVAALLFVAFSLFERYTSSFRLSRLQKTADLISKIQEIELTITNASPEVRSDYKAVVAQVTDAVNSKPLSLDFIPSTLHFSMDGFWKFIAGGSLWVVFALISIRAEFSKGSQVKGLVGGFLVFAVISGVAGAFVRSYWWPWFHIFIWPFVFLFSVAFLMLPVGYLSSKFAAKKNSQ